MKDVSIGDVRKLDGRPVVVIGVGPGDDVQVDHWFGAPWTPVVHVDRLCDMPPHTWSDEALKGLQEQALQGLSSKKWRGLALGTLSLIYSFATQEKREDDIVTALQGEDQAHLDTARELEAVKADCEQIRADLATLKKVYDDIFVERVRVKRIIGATYDEDIEVVARRVVRERDEARATAQRAADIAEKAQASKQEVMNAGAYLLTTALVNAGVEGCVIDGTPAEAVGKAIDAIRELGAVKRELAKMKDEKRREDEHNARLSKLGPPSDSDIVFDCIKPGERVTWGDVADRTDIEGSYRVALDCLCGEGKLESSTDDDGVEWYTRPATPDKDIIVRTDDHDETKVTVTLPLITGAERSPRIEQMMARQRAIIKQQHAAFEQCQEELGLVLDCILATNGERVLIETIEKNSCLPRDTCLRVLSGLVDRKLVTTHIDESRRCWYSLSEWASIQAKRLNEQVEAVTPLETHAADVPERLAQLQAKFAAMSDEEKIAFGKRVENACDLAEIDEFADMTPEEVDFELRELGLDPLAIGKRGAEVAAKCLAERAAEDEKQAWLATILEFTLEQRERGALYPTTENEARFCYIHCVLAENHEGDCLLPNGEAKKGPTPRKTLATMSGEHLHKAEEEAQALAAMDGNVHVPNDEHMLTVEEAIAAERFTINGASAGGESITLEPRMVLITNAPCITTPDQVDELLGAGDHFGLEVKLYMRGTEPPMNVVATSQKVVEWLAGKAPQTSSQIKLALHLGTADWTSVKNYLTDLKLVHVTGKAKGTRYSHLSSAATDPTESDPA